MQFSVLDRENIVLKSTMAFVRNSTSISRHNEIIVDDVDDYLFTVWNNSKPNLNWCKTHCRKFIFKRVKS